MRVSTALVAIYCIYIVGGQVSSYEVDNLSNGVESPEGASIQVLPDYSTRSKRDVSLSTNKLTPNSTTTHVSNTTMVHLLNNLGKKSTGRPLVQLQARADLDDENLAEADSVIVQVSQATFDSIKSHDASLGDLDNLVKKEQDDDLQTAANYDSKKYMLVKKKPKHKKIKMEVFEPEMKYKKIKMKIPVKKMKKKKVKGYLVKKHHYH